MILLIGVKRYGTSAQLSHPSRCPHCSSRVHFVYERESRWLTLYFVPLVPLFILSCLRCPLCSFQIGMTRREERAARRGQLLLDDGGPPPPPRYTPESDPLTRAARLAG
jgi:DNA-directed RNA polymerase subunit RPC12/RpoP